MPSLNSLNLLSLSLSRKTHIKNHLWTHLSHSNLLKRQLIPNKFVFNCLAHFYCTKSADTAAAAKTYFDAHLIFNFLSLIKLFPVLKLKLSCEYVVKKNWAADKRRIALGSNERGLFKLDGILIKEIFHESNERSVHWIINKAI